MQAATELLAPEVIGRMAAEIRRSGGNEVFFVGKALDGLLTEVDVLAYGNRTAVPALLQVPNPGDVVLHNHPSGDLDPSPADIAIASRLGNNSVAFYIVNNDVTEVYPVVKAFVRRENQPVGDVDLATALKPGGALAKALPNLEDRPGQHAMLAAVAGAFNRQEVALLEAGTGTGKTFAYLLPALDWAIKNDERVAVATHTINLQEQIIHKDAQALRAVFGDDIRVVLVKGRGNYVSLRRIRELEQNPELLLDDGDASDAQALIRWAYNTKDGSLSDLSFQPKPDLWDKVQSETDNCLRHQCPHYQECFFFKARRAALTAHLMVANHHVLFADVAMRAKMDSEEGGLLPAYKHLILDEAHHVEDVATQYFGSQVTRLGFQRTLWRMLRDHAKGERGSLVFLERRIERKAKELTKGMAKLLVDELRGLRPLRAKVEAAFTALFDAAHLVARAGDVESGGEVRTLRLIGEVVTSADFIALQERALDAIKELRVLLETAGVFIRRAGSHAADGDFLGPLREFTSAVDRLAAYGEAAREVLLADTPNAVRWLETKASSPRFVHLRSAPVEVAELLATNLFEKHETVVLTSATLAVAGDMRFLRQRTGIDRVTADRVVERQFSSPFDYVTQARVYVADDLPSADKPDYEGALAEALPKLLLAADGRAFVLFTSFRSLERQFRETAPWLESAGIRCFKQGEAPRDKLLKAFREDVRSVLFGTDSFWEGVDVEGESLSTVIITRLPFRVPTEPVLVARGEAIKAAGGRAFIEYTVPAAVIKFRQGFGRLIRNGGDRGVVIVTDKRIVSRPYGRAFRESLPPAPFETASVEEIEAHVRKFFAAR